MELLKDRGWIRVGPEPLEPILPCMVIWRLGWEPFCVELELWGNGEIKGRLCAPGLQVQGNIVFESLKSVEDAVDFLEKLLQGALTSLPKEAALQIINGD